MFAESDERVNLRIEPLTKERWADLEKLFGPNGACTGCWCMWWRLAKREFDAQKGLGNKKALKKIVSSGGTPGVLAYIGDEPVAWCSVEPREAFPRLEKARTLRRIDSQPVWSIVCLFVAKAHRRQGVGVELLKRTVKYVRSQGGKIVEGYPFIPKQKLPDPFVWTGTLSAYLKAGFKVAARPSNSRAIVRYTL